MAESELVFLPASMSACMWHMTGAGDCSECAGRNFGAAVAVVEKSTADGAEVDAVRN